MSGTVVEASTDVGVSTAAAVVEVIAGSEPTGSEPTGSEVGGAVSSTMVVVVVEVVVVVAVASPASTIESEGGGGVVLASANEISAAITVADTSSPTATVRRRILRFERPFPARSMVITLPMAVGCYESTLFRHPTATQ